MDPAASLVVVIIILWTSIPLVRTVGRILLQSTPTELDVPKLRQELTNIEGVISIHDLHIWQLVDGMTIASLHVDCRAGSDVAAITSHVKQIFHKFSIHSVTIQIELVPASHSGNAVCVEMCVEDCFEDWCCGDVKIIEDAALLDNIHGN
jgi:zinc transporter 1